MAIQRQFIKIWAGTVLALAALGAARAAPVYYTFDLHGGVVGSSPTPFISFQSSPTDSDGDGWLETVLKINLHDPALSNPYSFAQFRISYDRAPEGMTVNIGDSATNDGGTGDAGTQSNDAELQVGALRGSGGPYGTLSVFGNDNAPPGSKTVAQVPNVAGLVSDLFLTVGNNYAAWDDGNGTQGSASSPYLFALNGQADSEGPVNYDIYASFNRVIGGTHRLGSGVSQVTVCLSTDQSCFNAVPVPGTLSLAVLALGLLAPVRRRRA